MFLGRPWGCGLCVSVAIATTGASARAEPLKFHLEGGGARAVSGAVERETSLGFTAEGAVELAVTRALGIQFGVSTVTLGSGDPPLDPTLAPRSKASGLAVLAGLGHPAIDVDPEPGRRNEVPFVQSAERVQAQTRKDRETGGLRAWGQRGVERRVT